MEAESMAICRRCGHKFATSSEEGSYFHTLHCDSCGKNKPITLSQLGEAHLKYLMSHNGALLSSRAGGKKAKKKGNPGGNPGPAVECSKIIDCLAGRCDCGGQFKLEARLQCPKCNSVYCEKINDVFC